MDTEHDNRAEEIPVFLSVRPGQVYGSRVDEGDVKI